MATHHPIRKTVVKPAPEIPDKLYFRIGDVARLCEVPAYVLRFWESEFPQLKPNKGGTGQRLYRRKDVEMALRIKSLLYDQGYTIPGARQVFKNEAAVKNAAPVFAPEAVSDSAQTVSGEQAPAVAQLAAAQPAGIVPIAGSLARDKALHGLRNEMKSLLDLLGRPVSAAHPTSERKLTTMRPRLVLEPRPPRLAPAEPKPLAKLHLNQRDLFGPNDDGPMAS